MKRFFLTSFIGACLAMALGLPALAAEPPGADDAKAMVKKAAEFVKANGKEKAFVAFNDPKGQFVQGSLYLFVTDLNGKVLAHGQTKKMIGVDLQEIKDVDGKQFIKEELNIVKTKGSGWVDLKMNNPASGKIEQKSTYVERVDELMIGCGYYK